MRALRFARVGSLENLAVATIDRAVLRSGEVLDRIQVRMIDPIGQRLFDPGILTRSRSESSALGG